MEKKKIRFGQKYSKVHANAIGIDYFKPVTSIRDKFIF